MKINFLLIALAIAYISTPASADDVLIADMDKRLDENPELACFTSYKLMVKVLGNQSQQSRPEGFPVITLAPEEVYMGDCLALPKIVQKCLVDLYAYHRMDACQQARQEFENSRAIRSSTDK